MVAGLSFDIKEIILVKTIKVGGAGTIDVLLNLTRDVREFLVDGNKIVEVILDVDKGVSGSGILLGIQSSLFDTLNRSIVAIWILKVFQNTLSSVDLVDFEMSEGTFIENKIFVGRTSDGDDLKHVSAIFQIFPLGIH